MRCGDSDIMTGTPVPCSSCGVDAEWLVTMPHEPNGPGRLLVYCTACRIGRFGTVAVSIPLSMIDDGTFVALYCEGMTESDPEFASEIVFGVLREDLVERASHILRGDH